MFNLFTKKLKYALEYIERGENADIKKAKKIIDKHIEEELHFSADFNRFVAHLHNYDFQLKYVKGELRRLSDTGDKLDSTTKDKIETALVSAIGSLNVAKIYIDKLLKDEKS